MPKTEGELSPLDATFLELEQADEGALMHIGGALVFDPPLDGGPTPALDQLLALSEERYALVPRYLCRLSEPRVHGLNRPDWVHDDDFDVTAHVRRATLPAPGGAAELHEWLADFWSHRLDRTRPLWAMTLVDGLEGGAWMLATKTHHSLVDGIGSMDVGNILLDSEPHPAGPPTVKPGASGEPEERASQLPGWLTQALSASQAAADAMVHPRRIVKAGEALLAMGEVLWRDEVHASRQSSINVPIGPTRRYGSVAIDLSGAKAIKESLGGTVNDVILAMTAGALRRLLEHRGEALEQPLRAMVPVNIRAEEHGNVGNRVSSLFVDLPIGEADRRRRYNEARAASTQLKTSNASVGTSTILLVAGLMPPVIHEELARALYGTRAFNITVTNVPGPQMPLYALGCRLRRILPLVPLAAEHALGVAIVSYDGELVFGVSGDHTATPDLDLFTDALRDEYRALLRLARHKPVGHQAEAKTRVSG